MKKEKNAVDSLKRRRGIVKIAAAASAVFFVFAAANGRNSRFMQLSDVSAQDSAAVGDVKVMTQTEAETVLDTVSDAVTDVFSDGETDHGTNDNDDDSITETIISVVPESAEGTDERTGILSSPDEIWLFDTDGSGSHYIFTYDGREFGAVYTPDNWKIIDSYRIVNLKDITIICKALSDTHPIHGADMKSYRTPEDMAYEWQQHNRAYAVLPEDSEWRAHAKDVDLDPEDQGKDVYSLYTSRIGRSIPIIDKLFGGQ